MVNNNSWIQPTRLCLEHSSISLSSVQGWLCWAAIYARWRIRCEYISFQTVDATTAVLQRWYSVIQLSEISLLFGNCGTAELCLTRRNCAIACNVVLTTLAGSAPGEREPHSWITEYHRCKTAVVASTVSKEIYSHQIRHLA